jgi:uncharacterized integral membrane protein
MRKFATYVIVIPLLLILIAFSVANRHPVTVSFDPINSAAPAMSVSPPLYALIIAVAILGVIAGGLASWFGQRHWRCAARRHEADARDAKAQLADLRAAHMTLRGEPARLVPPSQGGLPSGFYCAAGRDKQGAVL